MLQNSFAQYFGNNWNEGIQKSTKDPLYMEVPDTIHAMVPTNVKIHINDPLVKEYAQYIEISAGNSNSYQTTGSKPSHNSGGNFRDTMPYNGEDVIEFGFRPQDRPGLTSSIIVTFYIVKEAPGGEFPDTYDKNSPFFGYGCNHERNKLLCDKEDGCLICNHEVGQVIKYYMMSDTDETVSIPTRVDFVDEKAVNKYLSVSSQDLNYNEKKKYTSVQGNEYESSDIYAITLNTQEMWGTFEEYKENDLNGFIGPKDKLDNPDVTANDISASGPELTGKAYEMVYNKALNPQNGADFVDIYYQLFAEMSPVGSGIMIVKATRQTVFEKGTGNVAELEAVRNDVLNLLSSYKLSKGKVNEFETEEDYMIPKWYVKSEVEEEETSEDYYVAGHISDYFDHPLPYMRIVAVIEGKEYEGFTDKDGVYKIKLEGLELKENEEKDVIVFTMFDYYRNNKNYFDVYYRKPNNQYDSVAAHKRGKLVYGEHLQIDFQMDGDGEFGTSFANKADIKHYSLIYFHTAESVKFVLETLKEDMDYKLPVTIYVGNLNKKTLYSPGNSHILISAAGSSLSDKNRPDNREYHEFMHALMFDIYNAWPAGRLEPGNFNHHGFFNPNTGDSYLEGFAEFMAMVISDIEGEPSPQFYANFGSMENNIKPWDYRGLQEELSVASILWDIYDERNELGDSITLSIEDMWKVLKVKRRDFFEYYKAFKQEFPQHADAFDEIFKMHGFFYDTRVGNGVYDDGEPWRYTNEQKTQWRIIDLSGNISQTKTIEYQEGFTVGKSADYNRSDRSSAARLRDAFLIVKDDEVDFYDVKVSHIDSSLDYEYVVDRIEGKVYVQPLPMDVDAVITVLPHSKDYTAKKVFTIKNKELNEILNGQNDLGGNFAEHNFDLKATGSNVDEKFILYDNVEPTYDYEGDLGEEIDIKVDKNKNKFKENVGSNDSGFRFPLGKIMFFLFFVVFGFYYFKKPGFKKKTDNFLKKVFDLLFKGINWFMKHGVPLIVKALKWILSMIVKVSNAIFHHSKKAYHKAKPHVIKAHKNIKNKINKTKKK